jgi:hypothetical protein
LRGRPHIPSHGPRRGAHTATAASAPRPVARGTWICASCFGLYPHRLGREAHTATAASTPRPLACGTKTCACCLCAAHMLGQEAHTATAASTSRPLASCTKTGASCAPPHRLRDPVLPTCLARCQQPPEGVQIHCLSKQFPPRRLQNSRGSCEPSRKPHGQLTLLSYWLFKYDLSSWLGASKDTSAPSGERV